MYKNPIGYAEEVWEKEIIKYCSGLFDGCWLPSHDLEHHQRVWKNACLLASHYKLEMKDLALESFFEQLIIACYFHDLGLLYEKGTRHGKESRLICERFLTLCSDKIRFDTSDLLLAIDHHDDKDYKSSRIDSHSAIYQLLTLADDLDAFGAIGCYRYIEIYLMRGLEPNEIPFLIVENAGNRYRNFLNKMKGSDLPVKLIEEKYARLKKLLLAETFNNTPESLVEWINNIVVQTRIDPFNFFRSMNSSQIQNDRIEFFIDRIRLELN